MTPGNQQDPVILNEAQSAQPKDLPLDPIQNPVLLSEQSEPKDPHSRTTEESVILSAAKDLLLEPPIQPSQKPSPAQAFFFRWLTYLLLLPLMLVATTFFGCLALLCALWDKSGRQQHTVAHVWGAVMLALSLSPLEVVHKEKLRNHPIAVYASNHLSYMDTPVLFAKLPFQFRIFAKASLWKIPFIGWYLDRSGQVPIDQKSSRTMIAGLLRGVATMKEHNLPLVIFPEGGRTPDGDVHAMASGGAFMAIRAQVPIVPLALVGTRELLPMHTYHLTPRPLRLVVGDPIPTTGLTTKDAERLTDQLFQTITALHREHSAF